MNEKEKIFPKGITAGTLYLTDSALIFRSKNTNDRTEEIILFTDVKNVKKVSRLDFFTWNSGVPDSKSSLLIGTYRYEKIDRAYGSWEEKAIAICGVGQERWIRDETRSYDPTGRRGAC